MKIKVINPNTTSSMTQTIAVAARAVAAPDTHIVAVNPDMGPVSIEGFYDEAVSVLGVLDEVRKGSAEGVDAFVIACFGDPGLDAAREIAHAPVIGVAEAAMRVASYLTTGFTVVTTLRRTISIAEHLALKYGAASHCRNVRAADIAVLDLEDPATGAYEKILAECRLAMREDRCGAIVLGCAGMADLCGRLQRDLEIPVIDGVGAAVCTAEALVRLRLSTSKRGDYAYPLRKPFTGTLAPFAVWTARFWPGCPGQTAAATLGDSRAAAGTERRNRCDSARHAGPRDGSS